MIKLISFGPLDGADFRDWTKKCQWLNICHITNRQSSHTFGLNSYTEF